MSDTARLTARMLCAVGAVCLLMAVVEARLAPFPSAEPSRGTDEPFSRMPFRRTLAPRQPPARWTGAGDTLGFCDVPRPATIEVRLSGHATPVSVSVQGQQVGTIDPGAAEVAFPMPARTQRCDDIGLKSALRPGGPASGRLDRLQVRFESSWIPGLAPYLLLAAPALLLGFCAHRSGFESRTAAMTGAVLALVRTAYLWSGGLHRSPYATTLSALLIVGALGAWAFARFCEKRAAGSARWTFAVALLAFLVQAVAATSPVMVVSDVLLHAHKLESVVRGDYFPVSVTQHARPFTIPYGVSLYVPLVPFAEAGFDPVTLVRFGAGLAGLAASAGLFLVALPHGAPFAAAAALLFQLVPVNFDAYSYGNLNHVFGHALTLLFFCWWAGRRAGGWPTGAALLAIGATAHLASFITLAFLCACLVAAERKELRGDRTRLFAILFGLGVAALYYSRFVPVILAAVPGLGQGYGQTGQSRPFLDRLWFEVQWARIRWGLPAVLLALAGWPRAKRGPLDRSLLAFWVAGGVLAVAALFSPLDVRYLYALTPALALCAARGACDGLAAGRRWRLVAAVLLLGQTAVGIGNIIEAVYFRYRP